MDCSSPLTAYQQAIDRDGFKSDPAQWQAAQALHDCHQALHQATPGHAIKGVYLWGPVGRGKTWLMDSFYKGLKVPARRQHFHHFMRWVHMRLFQLTGTPDPLQALAVGLSREVSVLCFDELFVSDIGDAIILGRLFQVMFEQGVALVATSNQPPELLYAEGFNRERFLPAVKALQRHMQVVSINGEEDHRLHPGIAHTRYWVATSGLPSVLSRTFSQLAAGKPSSDQPLTLGNRSVQPLRHCDGVLWCRFADLCEQPLAAPDFIALCDRFQAILLSQVPNLSSPQRAAKIARGTEDGVERVQAGDRQLPALSVKDDSVRRFIALVDECYDRKVPLYLEAQVPLAELYTEGYLSFAFRRTLSRLQEMQLQRFGA